MSVPDNTGLWMPIESAPKDRNIIISGRYPNGRAYVEECCWSYKGHWTARQFDPPTHWMPLPDPPGGWDVTNVTKLRASGDA